jgi:hypothetical protein
VAIVDRRLAFSHQSRHDLDNMSLMGHRDLFGGHTHINQQTNQPTGDRIRIGAYLNRAALGDAHAREYVVGVEAFSGQAAETRPFFGEAFLPVRVGSREDLLHETHVLFAAGEITTATKQQRLIDTLFEMSVGGFDIPVLVGTPSVRALRFAVVVLHQRCVPIRQRLATGVISHGCRQRIRTMPLGHSTEFPERLLNAGTECFKRFGKAQRHGFHIAVRQDAVVQRMIESRSGDRDPQLIADREVTGCQPPRMMDLAEEDRLAWTVKASPLRHTPFKRASSRIGKPTDVMFLQPVEQGLRSELRLRLQLLLHFAPNFFERIDSRAVVSNRFLLRWQSFVIAVLACGFLTHLDHPCRSGQRSA